jgi:hypothetical protein
VLSAADVERRRPVWHALSELFLDTELQPDDYRLIAGVLRRSGLEPDALREILESEVAPAFKFNLMQIAGEWAPWTEQEAHDIVQKRLAAAERPRAGASLLKRPFKSYLDKEWEKIVPLLAGEP